VHTDLTLADFLWVAALARSNEVIDVEHFEFLPASNSLRKSARIETKINLLALKARSAPPACKR
jgi:hypothetical protein